VFDIEDYMKGDKMKPDRKKYSFKHFREVPKPPSIDPKRYVISSQNKDWQAGYRYGRQKSIDPKAFEAMVEQLIKYGWDNLNHGCCQEELRESLKVYLKAQKG